MNYKGIICVLTLCIMGLNTYAQSEKLQNVLLICIDDLRPELSSFGQPYIHSPNIDKLAQKGRVFLNHYVNAPSCGPSRYTLLTGVYGPSSNNALFQRAEKISKKTKNTHPSMPEWFRNHGYRTVSVGKVSHHPGGLGGKDWNDKNTIEMPSAWDSSLMPVGPWKHPRGAMHGLKNGTIRSKEKGTMPVYESANNFGDSYPDDLITKQALSELENLASNPDQPFFLAVGIIKPHLPFGVPQKYLDHYDTISIPENPYPNKPVGKSTWHSSNEIRRYDFFGKDLELGSELDLELKKYYAACVSYADAQVGQILRKLKATGADKNTVIVLWGDHGWNLGEHGIWGKHNLFDVALKSPLIITTPQMKNPGAKAKGIVETLDIFPTLCDLTGIAKTTYSTGKSLIPMLENADNPGHSAVSYWKKAKTIRVPDYRLIVHDDNFVELYNYESIEKENLNIAESNRDKVNELKRMLQIKLNSELDD